MQTPTRFLAFVAASLAVAICIAQPAHAWAIPDDICSDSWASSAKPLISAEPKQSRLEMIRQLQKIRTASYEAVTTLPHDAMVKSSSHCVQALNATHIVAPEPLNETTEQPPASAGRPDVFGSVAVPISHTPLETKWKSASQFGIAKRSGPWAPLLRLAFNMGRVEQLQVVNKWVNTRVRFSEDSRDKRGADHWSGASETLRRRRGDCEDYAIAKMKLLEAVGISRSDMYLVVVDDLVRRADHALLVVRLGNQLLVLDNSTDQIFDSLNVADYRPIFSYSIAGAWIHGYAEKDA